MEDIISVLVAANNDEDRDEILSLISDQSDIKIVGVEKDEASTIIRTKRLKPDILIVALDHAGIDAGMDAGIDALMLARIIHRKSPSTSIMMLYNGSENDSAGLAIKAGISGYLLKSADIDKLVHIIKIIYLGGYYISASITQKITESISTANHFANRVYSNKAYSYGAESSLDKASPFNIYNLKFTSAERSILKDIADGLTDNEIAQHLNYSLGTVRNYETAIKHKVNLKTRVQLVFFSLQYSLGAYANGHIF